jgi:two-component system sensor kinase FixL
VTVLDDGIGLTAEEAQQAFDAYLKGPGGGAGLGLTIAREIVAAHGGQVWLVPRPEGGAEAGFNLPVLSPSGTRERDGSAALAAIAIGDVGADNPLTQP